MKKTKTTAPTPLSKDEIGRLHELTEVASKSNHRLIEAADRVIHYREMLAASETELATARKENAEVHAALAPLFHRLPTVP